MFNKIADKNKLNLEYFVSMLLIINKNNDFRLS